MHTVACTHGNEDLSLVLHLRCPPPLSFPFETGSLGDLELTKWAALHGQWTPDTCLTPLPSTGLASIHYYTSFLIQVLGIKSRTLLISPDFLHSFKSSKMTHFSKLCMNFYCSLEKSHFSHQTAVDSTYLALLAPQVPLPLSSYPPCCPHWADFSLFSSPVSFPLKTLCLSLQCPNVFWSNLPHSLPSNSSCAPTNFSLSNSCSFLNPLSLHGAARMCGLWDWNIASSQLPIAPLLGWDCMSPIHNHTGVWTGLILCLSCTFSHRYCEWVHVCKVPIMTGKPFSQQPPLPQLLQSLYSQCFLYQKWSLYICLINKFC